MLHQSLTKCPAAAWTREVMDQSRIEATVRRNVGKIVSVSFGRDTETVLVLAVDPDGFICRLHPADEGDRSKEFWIAYGEVTGVTEP